MSKENRKLRKPIPVNFAILVLLLISGGFTLSACQQLIPGEKSTEPLKENQSGKAGQQKSLIQLKKNQPEKSDPEKPNEIDDGLDTPDDDDPE